MAIPSRSSLQQRQQLYRGEPSVSLHFLQTNKAELMSAQLQLDGMQHSLLVACTKNYEQSGNQKNKWLHKDDSAKTNGFYNHSNVIRIESEGERQKQSKYIYVFRVFRFLSPTKLNRNELAGYSEAHSIQPLCLSGVGTCPVLRV